ncbi:MAG: hypothetical protein ACJ739_02605 [Acidimicrobiales bacterium]
MTARRQATTCLVVAGLILGACAKDEGSTEELCAAVSEDGVSTTLEGFDPTDPEAALDQLRDARVTLGDLLDAAPGEVRDDLQTEIDYVQALVEALEGVEPGDATESALQIQAVTDAHPDVDEAAADLAAFAKERC